MGRPTEGRPKRCLDFDFAPASFHLPFFFGGGICIGLPSSLFIEGSVGFECPTRSVKGMGEGEDDDGVACARAPRAFRST